MVGAYDGLLTLVRLWLSNTCPGFDEEGRKELKNLVNTRKWIGTSGKLSYKPYLNYS